MHSAPFDRRSGPTRTPADTVARPGPMRVARSAPDLIDIRGRDAMRASLLLGVALIVCVVLVLVETAGATSPAHVGAWSLVGVAGLVMTLFGWPRLRRIGFKRGDAVIRLEGTIDPVPVADARLRLSAVRTEGVAGPSEYGVVLERSSGTGVVVLSDPEPERVLHD